MPASRPQPVFPFTAIVGQQPMQLALLLNAVNPRLGGVLIRGEKGAAKSTAVRGLASLLPEIAVVDGCPYGCDPADPEALCDECAERRARGEPLPSRLRPAPMVELPVGATEDRLVGTLDLERAIQEGRRQFEPGLLARANRGILSVDEVNLLPDHLVDALLDAAAMGRNYVEREGVSVSHPAQFVLVGTMNPEEGELRPQLLDRFALMVEARGLPDPAERAEVVRRRVAFERDPAAFIAAWADEEAACRERLRRARDLLPRVRLDDALLMAIARLCAAFEVDGLRADIVMHRAAVTLAALAGRTEVTMDDLRRAAELALPHRRRRQPFDQPGLDRERLERLLDEHAPAPPEAADAPPDGQTGAGPPDDGPASGDSPASGGSSAPPSPDGAAAPNGRPPAAPAPDRTATPDRRFRAAPLDSAPRLPAGRTPMAQVGKRRGDATAGARGAYVGSRPPSGPLRRLALAPTIRAAAPYQALRRQAGPAGRGAAGAPPALQLRPWDLRERVHRERVGNLILFVVDASGSMGAGDRMAATKGAMLALLLDAYRTRDRVGLVVFRDRGASLLLPPTSSVDRAERALATLPTGGRTPLAQALYLAADVLERSAARHAPSRPFLVLLSDGRANVELAQGSPMAAALAAATQVGERLARLGGRALVVDTEAGRTRLGLARALAGAMAARCLPLEHLRADGATDAQALDRSVRALLTPGNGRRAGYGTAPR